MLAERREHYTGTLLLRYVFLDGNEAIASRLCFTELVYG